MCHLLLVTIYFCCCLLEFSEEKSYHYSKGAFNDKRRKMQTVAWENFVENLSVSAKIKSSSTYVFFGLDIPCYQNETELDVCLYVANKSELVEVYDNRSTCYINSDVINVYFKKEFTTHKCCGPALCLDGLTDGQLALVIGVPLLFVSSILAAWVVVIKIRKKSAAAEILGKTREKDDVEIDVPFSYQYSKQSALLDIML